MHPPSPPCLVFTPYPPPPPPLSLSLSLSLLLQCVKALIFHKDQCDINAANTLSDTPLHNAARWGYGMHIMTFHTYELCTITHQEAKKIFFSSHHITYTSTIHINK